MLNRLSDGRLFPTAHEMLSEQILVVGLCRIGCNGKRQRCTLIEMQDIFHRIDDRPTDLVLDREDIGQLAIKIL